jgi:glycosyltransferase involved in cell wall biosynthesis
VSTLPTGGAERVTFNVLTQLDPERFESEVYFLKEPGSVGQELLERGVRGVSRLWKHRFDPFIVVRLSQRLRAFSPDVLLILNCHRNAMFWGGLCSLVVHVGTRVIAVHHTGTMKSRKNFNGIDRLFLRSTSSIVALSESHARYLEHVDNIPPEKITIIENGIVPALYENPDVDKISSLRRDLALPEESKVVIMVAGLRPEKAHEALLQAASRLVPDRPDLRYLLVGDGPRRQELEQMAHRLNLRRSVAFVGERSDIPDLLNLADLLVLPSYAAVETLPLSVMEAMAAGVPVIASRVGSVPDMIEDGVNGRLISPGSAEDLASAITELIDNEPLARAMASAARRTVHEKYTRGQMVDKYSTLIERLATARHS